jgi:hypothetical protein
MYGWPIVITGVAVLFLVFLVWQLRPGGRRHAALGTEVRAARARAHAATTPEARADALCDAGALAIKNGGRWTAAAGSFLRAMNADPTSGHVVERFVVVFRRRRPHVLEKILWRRLAHLPWDDTHRPVLAVVTSSLRQLYEKERHDATRAAVFRRLEATFQLPGQQAP